VGPPFNKENGMGYVIAFVLGIFVATVGVTGVVKIADNGVQKVQEVSKTVAK
jgi:hypothetical protein